MLIYRLINESRVVTASYSPDERLLELFYRLAMAKEPVRLTDLAEQLLVSKSTIVRAQTGAGSNRDWFGGDYGSNPAVRIPRSGPRDRLQYGRRGCRRGDDDGT